MKNQILKLPIRALLALNPSHPAVVAWVKTAPVGLIIETAAESQGNVSRVLAPMLVNSGRLSQRQALDFYDRMLDIRTRESLAPIVFALSEVTTGEVLERTTEKKGIEPCVLWAAAPALGQRLFGDLPLDKLKEQLSRGGLRGDFVPLATVTLLRHPNLPAKDALRRYRGLSVELRRCVAISLAMRNDVSPEDTVATHSWEEDYCARERVCDCVFARVEEFTVEQIVEMIAMESWGVNISCLSRALHTKLASSGKPVEFEVLA